MLASDGDTIFCCAQRSFNSFCKKSTKKNIVSKLNAFYGISAIVLFLLKVDMFRLMLFCLAMMWSPFAYSSTNTGKVTFVAVTHDTSPVWVIVNVDSASGGHACAVPNPNLGRYVFTSESSRGKEMLALILSAESRQVPITIVGNSVCVDQGRESVNYIFIGDPSI